MAGLSDRGVRRAVIVVVVGALAFGTYWATTPHDTVGRVEHAMKQWDCASVERETRDDGVQMVTCNNLGGSVLVYPGGAAVPAREDAARCVLDDAVLVDGLIGDGFPNLCDDLGGRLER
jgi:hypothetical protein